MKFAISISKFLIIGIIFNFVSFLCLPVHLIQRFLKKLLLFSGKNFLLILSDDIRVTGNMLLRLLFFSASNVGVPTSAFSGFMFSSNKFIWKVVSLKVFNTKGVLNVWPRIRFWLLFNGMKPKSLSWVEPKSECCTKLHVTNISFGWLTR